MNVTREVVKDLLTLSLAGEASPDSRALVDDWLRSDPELAAEVERARRSPLPAVAAPSPSLEKRAFDRTRRLLRGRAVVIGGAIYFTTLPLAVAFDKNGFRGLVLEEWPSRLVSLGVAFVLWFVAWWMTRRAKLPGA